MAPTEKEDKLNLKDVPLQACHLGALTDMCTL